MEKQELKAIPLSDLKPNPHNFRSWNDEDQDWVDFIDSIKTKGVIQPILVRPVEGTPPFEIVFGERRYRASCKVADSDPNRNRIPAIVKDLSDKEAYDLMVIENLQRANLSEFEEARTFKDYIEKNGMERLEDLAERTGIKPYYIRRRIAVLDLPDKVLKAWGKGEIKYGYLEQLRRLDDVDEIIGYFEEIMSGYGIDSVRELKRQIDNQSFNLSSAIFDLEKEGCLVCNSNSDVQLQLFRIDAEKAKCQKPECFLEKQNSFLSGNWKKTKFYKKYRTNGYAFMDNVDREACNFFPQYRAIGKEKPCFECESFLTVFTGPNLNVFHEHVCVGNKKCHKAVCHAIKGDPEKTILKTNGGDDGQKDQPRVEWHGTHFREIFFKEKIPQRFENISSRGLKTLQLVLFALVKSNFRLKEWFLENYGKEPQEDEQSYWISDQDLFRPISEMNIQQIGEAIKAATLKSVLFDEFSAEGRRVVGEHIGIDLSKEWIFTEEYFQKKHKSEMLTMGKDFGLFEDQKAKRILNTLNKKKFENLRKKDLVKVFLESGVDLSGMVPSEILN